MSVLGVSTSIALASLLSALPRLIAKAEAMKINTPVLNASSESGRRTKKSRGHTHLPQHQRHETATENHGQDQPGFELPGCDFIPDFGVVRPSEYISATFAIKSEEFIHYVI